MSKLEDAGYQIARGELVRAVADAVRNGVDYEEIKTKAFHDEVDALITEAENAELVAQDEMRQREEDSQ